MPYFSKKPCKKLSLNSTHGHQKMPECLEKFKGEKGV